MSDQNMTLCRWGRILPLAGMLSFLLISGLWAQNATVWGTVDTRVVVMLHPGLADFDFTRGRFFRLPPAKTSQQALQEMLNTGITSIQPKLAELRTRQSEIVTARASHLLAFDRELTEIRAKRTKGAASATIDLSRQTETDLQSRLVQGLTAFDAQLAVVDAQIAGLWGKTGDQVYLTSAETDERFSQILREIGEQTTAAAREAGATLVIETGWGMRSLKKAEDMVSIPAQSDAVNFLDTMIFHTFTNWGGPRERIQLPIYEKSWGVFAAGLDDKGQETVKRIVKRNPHISVGLAGFTPGHVVLRGGYDLTPAVARKLFAKYAIPEQLKNSYMGLLKDIGNSELRPR